MEVGFTGTRRGMTDAQMVTLTRELRKLPPGSILHHGDEEHADREAAAVARLLGMGVVAHPGGTAKENLARNRIVASFGLLIAAPRGVKEERRSGTWATIRYAWEQQTPVAIIYPDGEVRAVASRRWLREG